MKYVIIAFLFFTACIRGQGVNFIREDINFTLDPDYFYVDGYYWFANDSDGNIDGTIFFPVGEKTEKSLFDSVYVFKMPLNILQRILKQTTSGFFFKLNIPGRDTLVYNIKYRQKITSDSVTYILLSTRTWNRSLTIAEYKLILKPGIVVSKFSYAPDKEFFINHDIIYFWKRKNFMPEKNLMFKFIGK